MCQCYKVDVLTEIPIQETTNYHIVTVLYLFFQVRVCTCGLYSDKSEGKKVLIT